MTISSRVAAFLGLFLLSLLLGEGLSGQKKTSWALATSLGYGGLGCAAGYAGGREARRASAGRIDYRSFQTAGVTALTIGGCWLGARGGLTLGREADSTLAGGDELSTGARRGVQLGTVLAGATLATLISFIPASMEDGSDLPIITRFALSGAAVGALSLFLLNGDLYPEKSPPSLQLGRGKEGGLAFWIVHRF